MAINDSEKGAGNGLLFSPVKLPFFIYYLPDYPKKVEKQRRLLRELPGEAHVIYEDAKDIYLGLGYCSPNFLALKSGQEMTIKDFDSFPTGISAISSMPNGKLMVGGVRKFTDEEGNPLINYQEMKERHIDGISAIFPTESDIWYLTVELEDFSSVCSQILEFNIRTKSFGDVIFRTDYLHFSEPEQIEGWRVLHLGEKKFLNRPYYKRFLAINNEPIPETKNKVNSDSGLEMISKEGGLVKIVVSGYELTKKDFWGYALYELEIDLNQKKSKMNKLISMESETYSLCLIRNKENHDWIMQNSEDFK